jgi:hypothetical protein
MSELHVLKIAALFLGILAIPLGPAGTIDWRMPRPLRVSQVNRHTLPFSFEQVVSYFDDAFEKPGHATHNNIREYIESNAFDEYAAIVVSGTGQKIRVALVTNGDWGVNYIREFFEAPFFLQSESEQLYTLLDANPSARWANLGRFDVQIQVFETRKRILITAEFGPPGSYQSPRAL